MVLSQSQGGYLDDSVPNGTGSRRDCVMKLLIAMLMQYVDYSMIDLP